MTPITDNNNLPPLRLGIREQFATHNHESLGEILSIIRGKMTRQLAEKIVKDQKFFDLKVEGGYGTMRTDIIVLTEQEYADLMREQFKKGVQHAQGFMPTYIG